MFNLHNQLIYFNKNSQILTSYNLTSLDAVKQIQGAVGTTFASCWALWSCCWPGIESHKAQGLDPVWHRPPCCFPHHNNWRQRRGWGPNKTPQFSADAPATQSGTVPLSAAQSPSGCGRTRNPPVCTHGSGWWAAGCACSGTPRWRQDPSSSLRLSLRSECSRPGSSGRSTAGPGSACW